MAGVFGIFFLELFAYRIGTARLKKLGFDHDHHGHGIPGATHAAHGPEHYPDVENKSLQASQKELEKGAEVNANVLDDPIPQIIGVAILEFGVLLHSVLIGLTLAVDPNFKILFVVIVFHRKSPHISIYA